MAKLKPVEAPDIAQAKQRWQKLEEFKAQFLSERDYHEVDGVRRLNRQGLSKLAAVFHITEPEPPAITTQKLGDHHLAFVVTCCVAAPNGRRAYGTAACSTFEVLCKNPDNPRALHDALAIAHTQAKERAICDLIRSGALTAEEEGSFGAGGYDPRQRF